MNRNQVVVVVVLALAVAGLAIAAATVSTPSSSGSGDGPGDGSGSSDSKNEEQSHSQPASSDNESALFVLLGVLVVVASVLVALYMLIRGSTLRQVAIVVAVVAIVAIASILTLSVLMDSVPEPGGEEMQATNESGDEGGGGEGGRTPTEPPRERTDIPPTVLGAFGLAMLVLVGAVYRYSGSDSELSVEAEGDEPEETPPVEAIGEAAGRAADRLDADTGLENAVYRAWREMADALDVQSPRTTTPEEFAEIAVEAGMSHEDVGELTRLFEEVRYGDTEPTREREQRARDALGRIQETYAGVNRDE